MLMNIKMIPSVAQMIKRFPLQCTEAEHRALKVAAAQAGISMNQFIRDALHEKIARQNTERKDSTALAQAPEKPT
jgi:predicted HicB family RNase H-like nuclease